MNTTMLSLAYGLNIRGAVESEYEKVLHPDSLRFLLRLHQHFDAERRQLLVERKERLAAWRSGEQTLGFLSDTKVIREKDWKAATLPEEIADRRVEITGPVDRKMIINALNSGANVFMADLEDSNSPTWTNLMEGQLNLFDAVRRTIEFHDSAKDKTYSLNEGPAVLFVRPRGLHLDEVHLQYEEHSFSASLVDFGLFFYNNARYLVEKGSAPYFYLPKLEHWKEARWWDRVFRFAQDYLGIPQGTVKATVLIETLPGCFQADEIIHALRDHSAGLNCGRWDYIFSYIKCTNYLTPDRDLVTMTTPFMKAYTEYVVSVCHRRGVHAMGGMAAQIPIKSDPEADSIAREKVRADKTREVKLGHDGTWVAHPGLVSLAREVFDQYMKTPNQISKQVLAFPDAEDLARPAEGNITFGGIRKNVEVTLQYFSAWLSGQGAAAIHHLMEDAATAEISRTQLWQWVHKRAMTAEGHSVTLDWIKEIIHAEASALKDGRMPETWVPYLEDAALLLEKLVAAEELPDFFTTIAYPTLNKLHDVQ